MKLSFKLLLGFGLLLIVFVVAVVVTWGDMVDVQDGSRSLAEQTVPAMESATALERHTYELLLAARLMQYVESDQTVTEVKKAMEDARKTLDVIHALSVAFPTLQSSKYVEEKVAPVYKSYAEMLEKTIAISSRKISSSASMTKAGEEMFTLASTLMTSLFDALKETMQSRDLDSGLRSLDLYRSGMETLVRIQDMRRSVQRASLAGDLQGLNATIGMILEIEKNIETLGATTDAGRKQMVGQLAAACSAYETELRSYVTDCVEYAETNNARAAVVTTINTETTNASSLAQGRVKTISEESISDLQDSIVLLFSSAGVAVVLGILIALFLSRSISKPLSTIVGLASRAGEGDLTITYEDFAYEGRDELGVLASALSSMIVEQEKTMQEVVAVAENLSGSA
ncbi:MAG: methyl-accepting chemotaxis protein, partial [Synergistaceae bacterium]|nr:methyl-accepting chemotaxis protein [Synergistaceae bacterium]